MDFEFSPGMGKFSHACIEKDGKVIVYFNPHKHGDVMIEDLPVDIQDAWKKALGYSVIEIAEDLEEGSSGESTAQDVEDELQVRVDDRVAKQEAMEAEKDPTPE